MKKLIIFFVAIFLITATAILGALIFRVPILNNVVPLIASNYGVAIEEFNVDTLNVRQIFIPSLVLNYSDQGMTTSVSLKNINVEIDPWFYSINSIKHIHIDSLVIDIDAVDYQPERSTSDDRVVDWMGAIPETLLTVDLLKLNYHLDDNNDLRFAGRIVRNQESTELSGYIVAYNFPPANVEIVLTQRGQFNLTVSETELGNNALSISGLAEIENDWLLFDGMGKVAVTNVSKFLKLFNLAPLITIDALQGKFETKLEADLDLSMQNVLQSMVARIGIDTKVFVSAKKFKLQQAELDLRSECIVQSIQVFECALRQPLHANTAFTQMPPFLQDYVTWRERNYHLEINPANELLISIDTRNETEFKLMGALQAHVYAQNFPFNLNAKLSNLDLVGNTKSWQLHVNFNSELDLEHLISPVSASRIVAAMQGELHANDKNLQLQINKGAKLIAQQTGYQDIVAKKVELLQQNKAIIHYVSKSDVWHGKDIHYEVLPIYLQRKETKLRSSLAKLSIRNFNQKSEQLTVAGRLEFDRIDFAHKDIATEVSNTRTQFNLNNNQLSLQGGIAVGEQQSLVKFYFAHGLDDSSGRLIAELDSFQLIQSSTIKQLIAGTGLPIQFKAGQIAMNVEASWEEDSIEFPDISLSLGLKDITGDYAQNQFEQLNAAVKLQGSRSWLLQEPIQVKIATINIGVPITDISFGFDRVEKAIDRKPIVRLSEFSAQMLDGSIYAKDITIDLNQNVNEFSIYLFNLSLEKLLALNQTEDLIASGSFDGELPVRIENDKFIIQKGWLRADESGGVIKYNKIEEVLVGNPNLELVADLLKDFRYNEMSAQVDLRPGGELLLATKLHGRSPNAELNKQVNLNFNIEFNLWKFLESARLLTRIDQDIGKKILSTKGKK